MTFIIGLLTAVLVLNCLFLILLVLIQLPKKDAGAGIAFGGGATDALFGAGSGNVLTKVTKWAATAFFVLSLILAILNNRVHHQKAILVLPTENESRFPSAATPPPASTPTAPRAVTNLLSAPTATSTSGAATATNAPKQ